MAGCQKKWMLVGGEEAKLALYILDRELSNESRLQSRSRGEQEHTHEQIAQQCEIRK
jgi:hypothetical protein